jgi:hypothetical protein
MMTDSEVEEKMKQDGVKQMLVGVEEIDGSGVGVVKRVGINNTARATSRNTSGSQGELMKRE